MKKRRLVEIRDGVKFVSCSDCKQLKPIDAYGIDPRRNNPHKVQSHCKECACIKAKLKFSEYAKRRRDRYGSDDDYKGMRLRKSKERLNKNAREINDQYIMGLIRQSTGLKRDQIPKSLIDAHREQIKINRLIKQILDGQDKQHQRPTE